MSLSWRLFFLLSELAEKWCTTKNELLHWGVNGRMKISVCLDILDKELDHLEFFEAEQFRKQMFVTIKPKHLLKFALGNDTITASSFYDEKGDIIRNYKRDVFSSYHLVSDIDIHRDALHVMTEEVVRMEAEHPELLAGRTIAEDLTYVGAGHGDTRLLTSKVKDAVPAKTNDKVSRKVGGRPKDQLAEAVEIAYLHFHSKGNVDILKRGNVRIFLKSLSNLVNRNSVIRVWESECY